MWNLTPRQFVAQLNVHEDMLKQMRGNGAGKTLGKGKITPASFIDQIPGW